MSKILLNELAAEEHAREEILTLIYKKYPQFPLIKYEYAIGTLTQSVLKISDTRSSKFEFYGLVLELLILAKENQVRCEKLQSELMHIRRNYNVLKKEYDILYQATERDRVVQDILNDYEVLKEFIALSTKLDQRQLTAIKETIIARADNK